MSEYFTNLPLINYDIDKTKPSNTTVAVDIFRRNIIRDKVLSNVLSFYPYQVKFGDRPDTIADQYYGSVDYMWLVLYANDIFDVYNEWPKFGPDMKNFIIKKYGSVQSASNTIHHYEQILRAEIPATADTPKINEKVVHIDKTTYDTSFLKSKSIIIYNIFNSKKKNKRGSLKKFNVGFVGTIDFHKGIDFLFECIKDINIKNKNINFVIAGNTSIKNGMLLNLLNFFKIKKNINIELDSKKKLLKNTKFIGAVNDLNKFYSNISLVVFPSRMNALGRPVIEAGFFNIPSVVCLNTNKFKDTLIHGRTGFITSFGDKKKFVNYILKFYENKKMLNKFGRNANKLFNKTHGVEKNLRLMKLTYNSSKK